MKKILFVLTSHNQLGNTGKQTGFWLEEAASPYYEFRDRGFEVVLASPKGGEPPMDPKSTEEDWQTDATRRFFADETAQQQFKTTRPLAQVKAADYDALFLPGGHGPMWDLATDDTLAQLIADFAQQGSAIAAVCHGPAGLVNSRTADGTPLVQGKRLTAFTNTEEAAVELTEVVPFLLESRLKELGASFERSDDFQPHVTCDGNLITGQNPLSSVPVAQAVIDWFSASET